jgi:hypothetical protein
MKAEQKGTDAQALQEFLRIRQEHVASVGAEKEAALTKGLSFQSSILQQIVRDLHPCS